MAQPQPSSWPCHADCIAYGVIAAASSVVNQLGEARGSVGGDEQGGEPAAAMSGSASAELSPYRDKLDERVDCRLSC